MHTSPRLCRTSSAPCSLDAWTGQPEHADVSRAGNLLDHFRSHYVRQRPASCSSNPTEHTPVQAAVLDVAETVVDAVVGDAARPGTTVGLGAGTGTRRPRWPTHRSLAALLLPECILASPGASASCSSCASSAAPSSRGGGDSPRTFSTVGIKLDASAARPARPRSFVTRETQTTECPKGCRDAATLSPGAHGAELAPRSPKAEEGGGSRRVAGRFMLRAHLPAGEGRPCAARRRPTAG